MSHSIVHEYARRHGGEYHTQDGKLDGRREGDLVGFSDVDYLSCQTTEELHRAINEAVRAADVVRAAEQQTDKRKKGGAA